MTKTAPKPGSPDITRRRRNRLVNLGIVVFSAIVLAYAFSLLPKQISPAVPGPLQVRTDLMRGQPCHVDNEVIMGDCSAGEIEALQRQAATP